MENRSTEETQSCSQDDKVTGLEPQQPGTNRANGQRHGSQTSVSLLDRTVDPAAETLVELQLQVRREEFAQGSSRYLLRIFVAVSVLLVGVWLLAPAYPQILIYALILLLLGLGASLYPALHRRNRTTAGFYLLTGVTLVVAFLSPLLLPSLMPTTPFMVMIGIMVAMLLLGERRSRWLVGAFVLAYLVDVVVVGILSWNPFPPLPHSADDEVFGAVSLFGILTAVISVRLMLVAQEQQFRRVQRLNLELGQRIQEVNETQGLLKRERNLLRTLIDAIPANVYIKDTQSRFVDANLETALQIGAKTANELIGKTDFDFFSPDLAETFFAGEQAVLQSGTPLRNLEERSFDQRTQQKSWFLTTKVPILDEQGKVTGLVGVGFDITERRQAQEQIAQERTLLRTLIDHLPDYIFIKDAEGRFVNSNAAHNRATHVQHADELRGKSAFEVFPAELAAQFEADDQQVLQLGQTLVNVERTSVNADGQERIVLTTKVPLRDAAGRVTGLVGISRDITERKQAEQALQAKGEAERQFQAALKALYEIAIELTQIEGLDDFYRRVVELARERLGFDRFGLLLYDVEHSRLVGTYGTDAQGKLVAEHDLQFDPVTLTEMLKRTLETSEGFALDEHAPLFSQGEPIGFGWNAVALLRNGEQNFGWLAADNAVQHQPVAQALLDILALYAQTVGTLLGRKRAEQALQVNEAKLKTIFEVLPVGVSILNDAGQIVEMNPALERILDISMEGLLSGSYRSRKYIASDGRPMERSAFPSARVRVEQQAIHNIEVGVVKEDQTTIWMSVSAAALPGTNLGTITVTTDISERKRAEQQAVELLLERQRAQVLHQFIGDATHDLMTPITIITTSTDLARRAPDPERLIRHLDKIERMSETLQERLQAMLTMSQLDMMTSADLELRTVDLAQLLSGLVETFRPQAEAKAQQLRGEVDPQAGTLQADDLYLSMALAKVLDNAIHYTENGGTVQISITRHEAQVAITIRDTGIGIAEADRVHIFERFYRAKSHRPLDSGAGLGLSIAQRILDLHHGRIEVTSVVGSGSTFTILLPDN